MKIDDLKDFHYQLRVSDVGNVVVVQGDDVIQQSIRAILSTMPGERPRRPTFGSDIYNLLFSPIDRITAHQLKKRIRRSLNRWEDRIRVREIEVGADPDNYAFRVGIYYTILETQQQGSFVAGIRAFPDGEG